MMSYIKRSIWIGLAAVIIVHVALAAIGGSESPPVNASLRDTDYQQAHTALEQEDWQTVIEAASKVIERRPWHDDAHNLLGFAYRHLGDFELSLAHYYKALELNPHHRGTLEYLGEAYLQLSQLSNAKALLRRLATECKRVAKPNTDWRRHCTEWQDLKHAIDQYEANSQGRNLNPVDNLALGQRAYYRSCVHCHGIDPTNLPYQDKLNFSEIVLKGTDTKTGMGFKLNSTEVETIRLYLQHCLNSRQMC